MIKKTTIIHDPLKLSGSKVSTVKLPVPEYLYIATANARCPKADIYVKEGDQVKLGQVIGMRHAAFFDQPIHATCSGTFEGYEKHFHRSGKAVDFMKFHNDFKDEESDTVKERTDEEVDALTKEEVTKIVKDTASVGLGGSSFPTYIKMQTDKPINTILINGIECEPYIDADYRSMLEDPEEIIKGIQILQRIFNCKDARLCIKKRYTVINTFYNEYLKKFNDCGISVCNVKNYYPQGWEIAMIKEATGIKVESGHLPSEYGIMNFNVSTVIGIYQAVKYNRPVYERRVSVTGGAITKPSNFIVRIGTPVPYLINACGGYKNPETKKTFILGGPMMGASLDTDDCICTKTVTSIIILDHVDYKEEPCIRCGSCVMSCPVGLQPVMIMNAMKHMPVDKQKVKLLNPLKCIECGLCTFSCTSKIPVTDYVRRAKVIARLK